jgi:glycosyltransferase involved in cell wall biosynthesis
MLRPLAGFFYLLHLDALVYATAPEYYEPAGTFVIEAAAAGVPIVCERRGMMADTIQHGWNGLLFDNVTEAIEHVMRLKSDDKLRDQLAANGQLWASWYDVSVHLGRLKAIWRALGI